MLIIKRLISVTLFLISFAVTPIVLAKVQWSDNSITLVSGDDYKLTPDGEGDSTIVTLEHVSGHSWGDLFFFVDYQRFDNDQKANYWELTPRFSLGQLTKRDFSFGVVKDVLLDTTVEVNTGPGGFDFINYLYGVGFDLDIPGLAFSNINFYYRNNELQKNNWQTTIVFGAVPFKIGGFDFAFDGFADYESSTEDEASTLNFTTQLKWDVGALTFNNPKKFFVGIEYVFWTNKFGVKNGNGVDSNERNLNLILKVHL